MQRKSFERFYLEKVAVGEGCGCSEQIIGMRDMDARAQRATLQKAVRNGRGNHWAWLRRLFGLRGSLDQSLKR